MIYNELRAEKLDVDNRLSALHAFVASDRWLAMSESEHLLVQSQLVPMTLYSKILGQRIAALEHRPQGDVVEIHQLPESKAAE